MGLPVLCVRVLRGERGVQREGLRVRAVASLGKHTHADVCMFANNTDTHADRPVAQLLGAGRHKHWRADHDGGSVAVLLHLLRRHGRGQVRVF